MNFKLPIGFTFKQQQTTQQILDGQVSKYVRTWKGQRIYKRDYGIDWQSFNYQPNNDLADLSAKLKDFLSKQLRIGLSQITIIDITMQDNTDPNNFNFYLVYNYKGMFQSKVFIQINLDGRIDVNLSTGI